LFLKCAPYFYRIKQKWSFNLCPKALPLELERISPGWS
jgi:hypothetical protein